MPRLKRRIHPNPLIFGSFATLVVAGCFDETATRPLARSDVPASSPSPEASTPEPELPASPRPEPPPAVRPPPPPPSSPPTIDSVTPELLVGGGTVYITGSGFGRDPSGIQATLRSPDGGREALELTIASVRPEQIIATLPRDLGRFEGRVELSLTTRAGGVTAHAALAARSESDLGGATRPGRGLVGYVYQLQPGTGQLPDFSDACSDPSVVVAPPEVPCPFSSILAPNLNVPTRAFEDGFPGVAHDLVEWFALELRGTLRIDVPGTYTFESCSDDGSKVYVDGHPVILHDGIFPTTCRSGEITLEAGPHAFRVEYFQGPRYEIALQLFWTPPEGERTIIPESAFFLDPEEQNPGHCPTHVGTGCYWMENETGRYCWVPASWAPTRHDCERLDSCDGGGGQSGGGCYKWSDCTDCSREPW